MTWPEAITQVSPGKPDSMYLVIDAPGRVYGSADGHGSWEPQTSVIDRDRDHLFMEGLEFESSLGSGTLWAFDRSGILYWIGLANVNRWGAQKNWNHHSFEGSVSHGQDIAWGSYWDSVGMWIAAEDHFRFVSREIFSSSYRRWRAIRDIGFDQPIVLVGLCALIAAISIGIWADVRGAQKEPSANPRSPRNS